MIFFIKIVSGIFVALMFAAYAYRLIKHQIIRKRLFIMMREIAEIRDLKMDEYQLLHEQILGIDRQRGILIYLNYAHRINNRIVDLRDVSGCSLILKQVVAQLELTYRQPSRPPVSISFYRKYADPAFKRKKRINTAIYWKGMIMASPAYGGEAAPQKEIEEQQVG